MKTTIIVLLALVCYAAQAQNISEAKVPSVVVITFKSKFPSATGVKWEMEKKDQYEANFANSGIKTSAEFDVSGKWLETEIGIKTAELPKEVSEALAKQYSQFKITEAAKVESPDKGKFFEVEIANGKERYELQLSAKGEILRKKAITAKD